MWTSEISKDIRKGGVGLGGGDHLDYNDWRHITYRQVISQLISYDRPNCKIWRMNDLKAACLWIVYPVVSAMKTHAQQIFTSVLGCEI